MRRLLLFAIIATSLSTSPVAAQSIPKLREAAKLLVESPGQQLAVDEFLSSDAMLSQIEMLAPDLTDDQATEIEEIVDQEFAAVRAQVEQSMENAFAHLFTLEEIAALDAFYRTDEGAAIAQKMQIFESNLFVELGSALEDTRAKILERVEGALQ